jgi:hypothetical protein
MRTVPIAEPSADLLALLNQARTEDLVVQAPDGAEFVLTAVDDFDREVARTRQNAKLIELLDRRSQSASTVSINAVRQQLGLGD